MSKHPCCIRVIPYENDGEDKQPITMCLYVSTNGKGIPDSVNDAAQEMFDRNYCIKFVDLQRRPLSKIFTPLPSSEKQCEEEITNLSRKIEENLRLFNNRLNVTAVQASYKVTNSEERDIPCVAVFVLGKTKIPAGETDIRKIKDDNDDLFNGVEFDVLEGYYQPSNEGPKASYYVYPLRAGFGIGVKGTDGGGTLGGFLKDEDEMHYILSNEHVLRPPDADSDVIIQPAQSDYDVMLQEAKEYFDKLAQDSGAEMSAEVDDDIIKNLKQRREEDLKNAREKLEKIKKEKPREIGKYKWGLRENTEIQLGDKTVKFYVDAAIAELNKKEKDSMIYRTRDYCSQFGFVEEGTSGEIVSTEDFFKELRSKDTDELSFKKFGRTTGFTDKGRIDATVKELFVSILAGRNITVPKDAPVASALSYIPYEFCKDCKPQDKKIPHSKKIEPEKCVKCGKPLNDDNQVETFWAHNCFVIRKSKNVFCDLGDSGALVFDEDGKAWGLVHGIFDDQSRNFFFCLASPLCITLQALEQASRKNELKLWQV